MKPVPDVPDTPNDATATALITAARALFVEEGLPALTVRRVAQAAGCTTMQVYSRFGGKDGLLRALFDEGFAALAAAQQAVPASLPARQRVHRLCHAYLRLARERPHHYALMLGAASAGFTPPAESRQRAQATRQHLVQAVRQALAAAGGATRRADEVAGHLLAWCHGQATLTAAGLLAPAPAAAVDRAVDALLGPPGAC